MSKVDKKQTSLKNCPFCGGSDIVKSCVPLDYPTCNVKAYVICSNCDVEMSQRGNVKDSGNLLSNIVKMWNRRSGDNGEDDQCQSCHNALQCLVWSQERTKAKCAHWNYFKEHYASGNKKIIGAEILDEIDK